MSGGDAGLLSRGSNSVAPASLLATAWGQVLTDLRQHLQSAIDRVFPGGAAALIAPLREEPRFAWLIDTFGLDDLEAASVALCAAPDFDHEVRQAFIRLQGEPRSGRPDLAMLQAVLCDGFDERLSLRSHFAWDAPLFRHRLLQPLATPPVAGEFLCNSHFAVDPQILRTLCYGEWLDPRLARYCRLHSGPPSEAPAVIDPRPLANLITGALAQREPLALSFVGQTGSGRRATAQHLANAAAAKLLVADLAYAQHLGEFAELTTPLLREAWLQGAWLYLEGVDALFETPSPEVQRFLDDLAEDGGICIIASQHALAFDGRRPLAPLVIEFDNASPTQAWMAALGEDAPIGADDVELLASRYHLPVARIRAAGQQARRLARMQRGSQARAGMEDLVRAARLQGPSGLSKLARKVDTVHRWDDLVLPADAQRQLRELCARVEHSMRVFRDWGFGPRMSLGKGTSALFVGASGTGKTMAAEVIAANLGLDLYKIDLATIVSKYIGETEKNLDRVFAAARCANAVLLFDEADALFGKRSEVRDAHDRYANLEVAYLLQKMEEYEGLSILSTNLKQNLDEAFLRRLTYTVLFPFPAAAEREAIWRKTCPQNLPLEENVDFEMLARTFKLSGGNIRNALLAAAFFAAAESSAVGMQHLIHGVRRELQKAGKTVGDLDAVTLEPVSVNEANLRYG